jgi:Na+-translocating ferredoxin:NAD+ oxidoreductase RnfC subunit
MGLLTFKGGIHPDDGKRFSKDQPIKALLPTGDLIYPLSQHIGAPAVPVVKKGFKRSNDRRSGRICFCSGIFFCIR